MKSKLFPNKKALNLGRVDDLLGHSIMMQVESQYSNVYDVAMKIHIRLLLNLSAPQRRNVS